MSIEDNTFAAACYNENTVGELIDALYKKSVDKTDCKNWNLTPTQWRSAIRDALKEKLKSFLECRQINKYAIERT